LNRGRYFPYRYGHSLWAFIGGRYGDQAVGDVLRASLGGGGYREGSPQILGVDTDELSNAVARRAVRGVPAGRANHPDAG
jgi:hypothetical protein